MHNRIEVDLGTSTEMEDQPWFIQLRDQLIDEAESICHAEAEMDKYHV